MTASLKLAANDLGTSWPGHRGISFYFWAVCMSVTSLSWYVQSALQPVKWLWGQAVLAMHETWQPIHPQLAPRSSSVKMIRWSVFDYVGWGTNFPAEYSLQSPSFQISNDCCVLNRTVPAKSLYFSLTNFLLFKPVPIMIKGWQNEILTLFLPLLILVDMVSICSIFYFYFRQPVRAVSF